MNLDMNSISGATFSPCLNYRYVLWRRWGSIHATRWCMFVGLNCSTAGELKDDPTVRRCIGFAKTWGYGGLVMTNLFAYRATDPWKMKAQADPVGPGNDKWLIECSQKAAVVIAAWGTHGSWRKRDREVMALIPGMNCLGTTKEGFPRHPLYVAKDARLVQFCFKKESI